MEKKHYVTVFPADGRSSVTSWFPTRAGADDASKEAAAKHPNCARFVGSLTAQSACPPDRG